MAEKLKIDHRGEICILTLNRPEVMNALDYPLYIAMEDAVRESSARVIIITGAGQKAFCSGDDVKAILSQGGGETPEIAERNKRSGGLTPLADALLHTDIPVIAAVNGYALGWGMELALLADIRVASQTASFGELFVKRGLCSDAPGLGRLAALVGRERATELLLTGDIISATKAKEIGLVSRVCRSEQLMEEALAIAEKIASNPPLAVRSIKAGLRRTLDPNWRDVGSWAIREINTLMKTDDAKESASAFLEKRNPVFKGR